MEKNYTSIKFYFALFLAILLSGNKMNAQLVTQTFTYTGAMQSYTVPYCITEFTFTAKGAQGGTNSANTQTGGLGGMATGVYSATPGDVFNIFVGGTNGYNGGGAGGICQGCTTAGGGVGGGASDIRLNGVALSNRILVGAGGGGGGGDRIPTCGRGAGGGGGGGYYGGGGGAGWGGSTAGGTVASGGSQTSGGSGGTSTYATVNNGTAGVLGIGGAGGGEIGSGQGTPQHASYPGGAGGGLNGTNGTGPFITSYWAGQSGAGGSSFADAILTSTATSSANNAGNGVVTISYIQSTAVVVASPASTLICNGTSINLTTSGSVLSYSWNTGSNNSSITVSPSSNTVYVVSSINAGNCVSQASVFVTVNPGIPTLAVVSSTNQTCLGKTATLTASGAVTYTWSNGVTNGVSFNPTVTNVYTVTGQNACGTSSATSAITIAPLPVNLMVTPTVVCAGSPALMSAAAAATNYTWLPMNSTGGSNSFVVAPIVTTVYTVAVTDGTCFGAATVTLAANPIPTLGVTSSGTNVCEGDPLYLTATGGNNYTWTPGNLSGPSVTVNPTSPTAYVVTGDNSFGCTSNTSTFVVTVANPTPVISANANLICAGETVTLTATGANSYNWSGGGTGTVTTETPASTGVITVTGTTNGCVGVGSIQMDVFVPPISITAPSTLCSGGAANLTANGGISYTWNPGGVVSNFLPINPTVSTTYTVSAHTPTGNLVCLSDKTVSVNVLPNPNVIATADRTVICKNETTTLTAGGASTYNWIGISAGSSIVVTSSLITIINYTVVGTAANGCTAEAITQVKINSCTGLNEFSGQVAGIKLYPNPNSGEFTLEAEAKLDLNIVNQLGQVIKTIQLSELNNFKANVSGLSNGVYFIKDKNNSKVVYQKVVVN